MWSRACPAARKAFLFLALVTVSCHDQSPVAPEIKPVDPPLIPASALMLELSRLADDSMLGRGSGTVNELRAANYIDQQFKLAGLQSSPIGTLQTFSIGAGRTSQNVLGIVPGNGDLKDEWVVVGAHYDHKGVQVYNGVSYIYNGADDNGSGTVSVLVLAKQIAQYVNTGGAGTVARRSMMFIAFGSEELGLLGSAYYTTHPAYPLTSVYAMINFDMVGRMRDTLFVGGTATAAEWPDIVQRFNSAKAAIGTMDCSGCTDFAGFRSAHRPVLWFYTGTHPDYHQTTDDLDRINDVGLANIANLGQSIVLYLAFTPKALTPL